METTFFFAVILFNAIFLAKSLDKGKGSLSQCNLYHFALVVSKVNENLICAKETSTESNRTTLNS